MANDSQRQFRIIEANGCGQWWKARHAVIERESNQDSEHLTRTDPSGKHRCPSRIWTARGECECPHRSRPRSGVACCPHTVGRQEEVTPKRYLGTPTAAD